MCSVSWFIVLMQSSYCSFIWFSSPSYIYKFNFIIIASFALHKIILSVLGRVHLPDVYVQSMARKVLLYIVRPVHPVFLHLHFSSNRDKTPTENPWNSMVGLSALPTHYYIDE